MKLNQLSLYNYRGYNKQDIVFSKGVNLFIGDNGSGKTNLLESIYFLSLAKSYKTDDSNLIRFNQEFSRINSKIDINDKLNNIKIILSKNKKKIIFNDREIKKLSNYIGQVNVVSFLPEDMNLIKGPPKNRRYFIDSIIGQMDKNYLIELTNYKTYLKQRNDLIKQLAEEKKPDMTLLDIYTEQLSKAGEHIISYRHKFVKSINLELKTIYPYLSNNRYQFEFKYSPSNKGDLEKNLKDNYRKDLFARMTSTGPHRDDYSFLMNDINALDMASQGEQRIMILSSLLAVTEIIYQYKKKRPILLLDDVFSELDSIRQNKLIHYLNQSHLQTIITTTSTLNINQEILDDARLFYVKNHFIRGNKHE